MSPGRPADPDRDGLLRARLTAQLLSGEPASGPLVATRHLLAIQAQDPRGARLAIRARTVGGSAADVDRALTDERSLLVTWLGRGTLHLVAAEDEPWLRAVTQPQLRTAVDRRLQQTGVSPTAAARGARVIAAALAADGPRTRAQLRQVLDRAGVPTAGQALVHVLFHATLEGLIVRGPVSGSEQAFALVDDWLGPRRPVERDRALAELARRYLRGHGPAGDRDLAKWANLALRDVRRGLTLIASELTHLDGGLVELGRRAAPAPLPPSRLLGAFEPLLLGWRSRELVLPDPQEIVTTNGIIRAIVLRDGRVSGTWTLPGGRPRISLWGPASAVLSLALERDAEEVVRYLGPWAGPARG